MTSNATNYGHRDGALRLRPSPKVLRMSPRSRSRLRNTLRARILAELARDASIPGAVVAYARRDGRIRILAIGQTGDLTRPLQPADLFPVASVSKLATALLRLRLANASGIRLSDPIWRDLLYG